MSVIYMYNKEEDVSSECASIINENEFHESELNWTDLHRKNKSKIDDSKSREKQGKAKEKKRTSSRSNHKKNKSELRN
jgi:hypothetical protein